MAQGRMTWSLRSRKLRRLAQVLTEAVVAGVDAVGLRDEVLEMVRQDTERREAQRARRLGKLHAAAAMFRTTMRRTGQKGISW